MLLFAYLSILIVCCTSNNSAQMSKLQNEIMEFDSSYTKTINKDSNIASVFLDYNFIEDITVFDSIGQVIKTIKNDIENENVVMFQLLEKNDSMFHVIAYWSLDLKFLVDGWIYKKNHLRIFSASYNQDFILYEVPYTRENIVVTEKEYNPQMYEVIDFEGNWLKIRTKIENRIYQGWIPPEMQCSNIYSTCN